MIYTYAQLGHTQNVYRGKYVEQNDDCDDFYDHFALELLLFIFLNMHLPI